MLNLRKIVVAFSMALLLSTASFANSSNPIEVGEIVVANTTENVVTQSPSLEDEVSVAECCKATCTVTVSAVIIELSYSWCCKACPEEKQ